jgi:hypothetical protein
MEKDIFSWLTNGPVDYELKQYKMLAILKRLREQLDQNIIWPVIEEVEEQLDRLYKVKYEIEVKEDRLKVAKDIDFFNFEIIYETPENQESLEHRIVDEIVDDAIVEFGDVYMDSRNKWREIEKLIHLTWIPQKPVKLEEGYMVIVSSNTCHVYSFDRPTKMLNSWRSVKLEHVKDFEFTNTNIVKFYDDYQNEHDSLMFCRVDVKVNGLPLEDTIIPIAKSTLFNRLTTDFA